MKLTDTLSGALTVVLGLVVIAYASSLPPMPGQDVGPAFFPSIAGVGLVVFGGVLVLMARTRGEPLGVTLEDWARRPRMIFHGLLVPLSLLFYVFLVEALGFFLTSIALLAVLFAAFGVGRRWILPIAAGVTLALHYGFYTLLRVPLPWGVFERMAW